MHRSMKPKVLELQNCVESTKVFRIKGSLFFFFFSCFLWNLPRQVTEENRIYATTLFPDRKVFPNIIHLQ